MRDCPHYRLEFRAGGVIGANAFADILQRLHAQSEGSANKTAQKAPSRQHTDSVPDMLAPDTQARIKPFLEAAQNCH